MASFAALSFTMNPLKWVVFCSMTLLLPFPRGPPLVSPSMVKSHPDPARGIVLDEFLSFSRGLLEFCQILTRPWLCRCSEPFLSTYFNTCMKPQLFCKIWNSLLSNMQSCLGCGYSEAYWSVNTDRVTKKTMAGDQFCFFVSPDPPPHPRPRKRVRVREGQR